MSDARLDFFPPATAGWAVVGILDIRLDLCLDSKAHLHILYTAPVRDVPLGNAFPCSLLLIYSDQRRMYHWENCPRSLLLICIDLRPSSREAASSKPTSSFGLSAFSFLLFPSLYHGSARRELLQRAVQTAAAAAAAVAAAAAPATTERVIRHRHGNATQCPMILTPTAVQKFDVQRRLHLPPQRRDLFHPSYSTALYEVHTVQYISATYVYLSVRVRRPREGCVRI
jgi:hypothetical protein